MSNVKVITIEPKQDRVQISVRLPGDIKDWLTNYASANNYSMNDLIIKILQEVMGNEEE